MRWSRWLVRLAIALYPRSFRDRFGDEMMGVYLEQVAERRGGTESPGPSRLW
ncbi:MAG: hypothetical protein R2882_08170 [Gemmatimonadales bacterium]